MLRIAVQSKGRLFEDTMNLLTEADIKISASKRTLLVQSPNFPIEILYLRDDDIPQSVASGVADIGVVGENEFTKLVEEYANKEGSQVITMCAKLESELSGLEDEDRKVFMEDLGLNASGLDMLIKATYDLLGLKTFFTSGTDECRAWTFKNGMKAPECAGIIHTDFQKGFIKAEVMSYEDLERLGSEKAVQEAGKLRLEGKEYIMQDGDICFFRFNVTK